MHLIAINCATVEHGLLTKKKERTDSSSVKLPTYLVGGVKCNFIQFRLGINVVSTVCLYSAVLSEYCGVITDDSGHNDEQDDDDDDDDDVPCHNTAAEPMSQLLTSSCRHN